MCGPPPVPYPPLPGRAPRLGSPHPLTLRTTPGRWRRDGNGRAREMRMASWIPHRCHLQAPAAWLADTIHMIPRKGLRPCPLPMGAQGVDKGEPRLRAAATEPSPCVILADTISVIWDVSFCRNSSVPTSARDRWPRASTTVGSAGGQNLAQPVPCPTDTPRHPPRPRPGLGGPQCRRRHGLDTIAAGSFAGSG